MVAVIFGESRLQMLSLCREVLCKLLNTPDFGHDAFAAVKADGGHPKGFSSGLQLR